MGSHKLTHTPIARCRTGDPSRHIFEQTSLFFFVWRGPRTNPAVEIKITVFPLTVMAEDCEDADFRIGAVANHCRDKTACEFVHIRVNPDDMFLSFQSMEHQIVAEPGNLVPPLVLDMVVMAIGAVDGIGRAKIARMEYYGHACERLLHAQAAV
jgi:hypothetical protein